MYSDEHNNINRRGGSEEGEGGGVRRRPPTAAPYTQSAYAASSSNQASSYGTNEEDALLHSHNEEGYPVLQSYRQRRRLNNYPGAPWYRQPQKLILAATLAWVGGVMYLASLAHAILRTHKETSNNMMGISSMVENNEDFKEWLQSQGMLQMKQKKFGAASTGDSKSEDFQNWLESQGNKYGSASDVQNDADFQAWAEAQANKYGSSGEKDENYQQWLEYQANKYGSNWENNENYRQWLEEQAANKYGASAETNEDFQQWLQSQNSKNKYGAVNSAQNSASDSDAWQDWLAYVDTENSYGSTTGGNGNNKGTTKSKSNVNVRFGNSDANYQDWLEYQSKNKQVQYNANGMYGKSNPGASSRAMGDATQVGITSDKQVHQPSVAAASDSSISTIDWPLQGLPHASCTSSSGCSPSTNVTVLIVYGPEYHTHISEMAWNVATGVHTAFKSHIRHHPNSPLHGHIVFGHTSNVTFLDVIDADAVIIGSPVYNGNVHPDVQNWINYWHVNADLSNKFGGAFATAGGIHAGADGTIMSILRSMMVFQMMAVGGDSWTSPFGAVATMYEDPFGDSKRTGYFDDSCYFTGDDGRKNDHLVHPYFLRKAYGLGERIANVSVAWKNSSYVRW